VVKVPQLINVHIKILGVREDPGLKLGMKMLPAEVEALLTFFLRELLSPVDGQVGEGLFSGLEDSTHSGW
jgi:hypothetical protein